MDTLVLASQELESHLMTLAEQLAPSCASCSEFLPESPSSFTGVCMLHCVRVLKQDKACSNHEELTK